MGEVVAYHVDKTRRLKPEKVISFEPAPTMPVGGGVLFEDLAAEGMTRHGTGYARAHSLLHPEDGTPSEWFFELVRRAEFPECLSRFQSVFASPSLAGARAFRRSIRKDITLPIVRVRGESHHMANMSLIQCWTPAAATLMRAREYWRGEVGTVPPVWELALKPPVLVLDIVGDDVPDDTEGEPAPLLV